VRYERAMRARVWGAVGSIVVGLALAGRSQAAALPAGEAHGATLLTVLAALVLILIGAKAGGVLAVRLGSPAVLGELIAGIVLGNLGLAGWHGLEPVRDLAALDLLAQLGVLFLLFQVGLESDLGRMLAVGGSALLVATLGVVAPIALGWAVSAWFFPTHDPLQHAFVGAALCATSVGITARVLSDLGRISSLEGRIILGAAVIDDVLGLIVLAVVSGVIAAANQSGVFEARTVLGIVARAVGFLVVAVALGRWLSPRVFRVAARLPVEGEGLLLTLALVFCFGASFLAGRLGLAPIVGAFAAGLVLEEAHYRDLRARDKSDRDVRQLVAPIAALLVPVFFVLMGMRVDLSVFGSASVAAFAGALTLAAVVSKQVCALGVLDRGADRLAVGLGMIPRGEVGLIFAGIGATLTLHGERVVDGTVFSGVVVMVALTTLLTPPLLVWRLRRARG
jgi:Kef-type K+ transport system membrane component KefB